MKKESKKIYFKNGLVQEIPDEVVELIHNQLEIGTTSAFQTFTDQKTDKIIAIIQLPEIVCII